MKKSYQVFEDHIPANHKSDKLSDSNVGVSIGRSRCIRYSYTELSVAGTFQKNIIIINFEQREERGLAVHPVNTAYATCENIGNIKIIPMYVTS